MPNYRSINIGLHSQFDIETLPEYYPDPKEHYIARGITGFIPKLVDDKTSTCSVYVPVLPGSTFWIGYSVSPPVPDGHYFLFKLYINGTHIVSWSAGKEEDWKGKTMFGLFESPEDGEGKKRVEKRVFCFTPPVKKDREWKDVTDVFDETALVNAGRAGAEQPKRFYKFALIDPIDQPFATFQYYYRTWDQLRDLGLLEQDCDGIGEENDLSIIEPHEGSDYKRADNDSSCHSTKESEDVFQDCNDGTADGRSQDDCVGSERDEKNKQSPTKHTSIRRKSCVETRRPSTPGVSLRRASDAPEQPRAYIPRGAPGPKTTSSGEQTDEQARQRDSCVRTPPQFYRLSVPPSVKLDPPEQAPRPLPIIPQKSHSSSSTSYRPHPAYPVDEWTVRTPSPVKSVRNGISTPPLEKYREQGRSASSLMNVIASAWKRRGTQMSEGITRADKRGGARSVP